jgi:hypothetical protein
MGDDWYHQPAGRSALPDNYFQKPSPARMWNYLQGGRDNYALDRSIGDLIASCYPDMFYLARQAREFLPRTVRVQATIDTFAPILSRSGGNVRPGLAAADIATNQFLDPSIRLR